MALSARLGLRFVRGLRRDAGRTIARERHEHGPYASVEDLARRIHLRDGELSTLSSLGALASLGLTRRQALWQAARAARPVGPLFEEEPDDAPSPLAEMTPVEETVADFAGTSMTAGVHPVAHLRGALKKQGVVRTADLARFPEGARLATGGAVTVRQRPGTAHGVLFLTLEDETGMTQAIVSPELFREQRPLIAGSAGLVVEGVLQKRDGSISLRAERVWPLPKLAAAASHDFR